MVEEADLHSSFLGSYIYSDFCQNLLKKQPQMGRVSYCTTRIVHPPRRGDKSADRSPFVEEYVVALDLN